MSDILNRISVALRTRLDASTKAQLQAGFRDEQLELTKVGRHELWEILVAQNSDAFLARANAVIAEQQANKSC